jgi:hypothetical protein
MQVSNSREAERAIKRYKAPQGIFTVSTDSLVVYIRELRL